MTERRVHAREGSPFRVLALALLLVGGGLVTVAPPAAAQAVGDVCFTVDPDGDPDTADDPVLRCATGLPAGANYMQGDHVDITVQNVTVNGWVRVRCLTSCHETDGKSYYAPYSTSKPTVRFPRDFVDRGSNALADRAPRYNGSWEAVVLVANDQVIARGKFNVWVVDGYLSAGLTITPGERHTLRASGFDEGAQVLLRVERRTTTGDWVTAYAPRGSLVTFTSGGFQNRVWQAEAWVVPKNESERFTECRVPLDQCYRVVVRGPGKADEEIPIRVGPATLQLNRVNSVGDGVDTQPDTGLPRAVERTREVYAAVALHYPGGRVFQGDPLRPGDVRDSPLTGEPTLRARVERVNATGATPVKDLPVRYDRVYDRWEVRWPVTKDFPVSTSEPDARYRLKLLADQDRWGNRVPELLLGEHVVEPARIQAEVVHAPTLVRRTDEANVTLGVAYHNGTPVTPDDLRKPLQGCFIRESSGDPINCAGQNKTTGVFENGRWVFRVRFPRDHAHLENHRFLLMGGAEAADKWDNQVAARATGIFPVKEGSPRVQFSTVARGREAVELERGGGAGNHVAVFATITYGDGAPFNRHVNHNQSATLPGVLVKRGPEGHLVAQVPFDLREVDPGAGRWAGDLVLTADDTTTPLGVWTFSLQVKDNLTVPNVNHSASFDRRILGIPLVVEPVRQPFGLVATGNVQSFRFRVLYQDGNEVPHANLVDQLAAYVYRWDAASRQPYGNAVSPRLLPEHDAQNAWYQVEYRIPNNLFSGTYAFVVNGTDRFGNRLQSDAWSREFSTTSAVLERPVITQPPREVLRGESATVVFDAREGDVGPAGTGRVHVRVERFDPSAAAWVVERADARQDAPGLADHVGLFAVTTTTPVGLYRFVLDGRDANLQGVAATSANFSVLPTDVDRLLLKTPPERVVKGVGFAFHVERQDGDRFTDIQVLLNGRSPGVPLPVPIVITAPAHLNVTWEVPFDAPSGNYTFRLVGRDLYGNRIDVITPPIEAQAAQLTGRVLGNPGRSVLRGEAVTLLFGITYPTQGGASPQFYVAPEPPTVQVVDASGFVAYAAVKPDRSAYVATWTPPPDVPTGEYRFEVTGTGTGGNNFPTLRSTAFRVMPGAVARAPALDVGATVERMGAAVLAVPFQADDRFVEFRLHYYGPAGDATAAVFETREPRSDLPLAHSLDTATGRYVARFVTDHTTMPGVYRMVMRGEDGHGNELSSKSGVFTLLPTSVALQPDPSPPDEAFGPGKTLTISFVARYRNGVVMDESYGRPSAVVLYTAPGRPALPVTERPVVEYRDGRWYATWTAPGTLPEGLYEFSFGGADAAGNTIGTQKSKAYPYQETITGSAAKLLPGPGVGAILLVLAPLALLARRRRG